MEDPKILELVKAFWARKKIPITTDELLKINPETIKVWAWCTGMGSDADIYVITTSGDLIHYNYYKQNGYDKDIEDFCLLQVSLRKLGNAWELIRCRFNNNIYIHPTDREWFESYYNDLHMQFDRNPYACLECICRDLEKSTIS